MILSGDVLPAAHQLSGKCLSSGWLVKNKIEPRQGSTGGFFSVCYLAEKNGEIGFLKAIDFLPFFKMNGNQDFMKSMSDMTASYVYERDLLTLCRNRGFSKIPLLYDDGIEDVDVFPFKIPYLIFEKAEGNVRNFLDDFGSNTNMAWKLKSLHNVALGIRQLHTAEITHQDIKPSNVFVFDSEASKLGDLGRSIGKTVSTKAPHIDDYFAGQSNYAPPEILYSYFIQDWHKRVFAIDTYLFGSLIAFYFTGLHFNTLLYKHLDSRFKPTNWVQYGRTFEEVKVYLLEAFRISIGELANNMGSSNISKDIISLVEKLCNPIPEDRGVATFPGAMRHPYDFQQIISKLDFLRRRAEIESIIKK